MAETSESVDAPVDGDTPAAGGCVPREHLFALLFAKRDALPTGEEEDADKELVLLREDLAEIDRFKRPFAAEFQLGPETADAYWAHALQCVSCKGMLIEDGPDARPPKTEGEIAAETQKAEDKVTKLKIKFAISLTVGLVFFSGAFATITHIRNKQYAPKPEQVLTQVKQEIDPLYFLFAILIFVASWFLAEAYGIARELWVDFTAWKRAVPVIGKKWAEKSKNK
ncbi:MAG TPA: hypothetical protein DEA08_08225 [Planctomycetes bacterium]|nr:hypothetical protein [Planctomycetota bacterium]|tara:strand:+ start:435 stop:1109 length:675 start_codon:yes stop_codon:yes gene_type:complete